MYTLHGPSVYVNHGLLQIAFQQHLPHLMRGAGE